jgi:hypothetical protein
MNNPIITAPVKGTSELLGLFRTSYVSSNGPIQSFIVSWCLPNGETAEAQPLKEYLVEDLAQMWLFAFRDGYEARYKAFA